MKRSLFPGYRQKQEGQPDGLNNTDNQYHHNGFSQIQDVTFDYLRQMEANSSFFAAGKVPRCIPQFAPREVQLGVMLGQGEFGILLRVTGIKLHKEESDELVRDCCASPPLDHHHRLVSSSINLPAIADLQLGNDEKDMYDIHTVSVTKSGSITGSFCPENRAKMTDEKKLSTPPHHRVTQSVTISKLAHPPPLPIEQRTHLVPQTGQEKSVTSIFSGKEDKEEHESLRKALAAQVASSGSTPLSTATTNRLPNRHLALKQVRKDLYPKKKLEAAKDLAREAKFLAQLDHDNIITLRGVVSQPGQLEFGILLDRLGVTLAEEVSAWQKRQEEIVASSHVPVVTPVLEAFSSLFQPKSESAVSPFGHGRHSDHRQAQHQQHFTKQSQQLLGERTFALWDIARGMDYLHQHKILFRDLKTENVGIRTVNFDDEGDGNDLGEQQQRMQIFDFGLAKECKAVDCVAPSNIECGFYSKYHMTGLTGTLRIMAPEVIQCLPYGLPADVYSFGVCMWEIFSGTNHNGLTAAETCKGQRPAIPEMDRHSGAGMPPALQWLLKRCWAQDAQRRPTFCDIERQIHGQLLELQSLESQPRSRSSSQSASPLNFAKDGASQPQSMNEIFPKSSQASVWKRLETIPSSNALDEQGSPMISVRDN